MKNLKRHNLNYDLTLKFIRHNLQGANTLSLELLNTVDFKKGDFFVLLPEDGNMNKMYEFEYGGLLREEPTEEYVTVSGKHATYSLIPTLQDELATFISENLKKHDHLSCIFEDVLKSSKSPNLQFFREKNSLLAYENEIYYLVNHENVTAQLISKCIEDSNATWHFLCVLTDVVLKNLKDEKFTLDKIKEVCLNTRTIVVGAYDSEAYVFWEKKD
jgi:hypothetical protein